MSQLLLNLIIYFNMLAILLDCESSLKLEDIIDNFIL